MSVLERAWQWREELPEFKSLGAVRIFHGPGEGVGDFQNFAIDVFRESDGVRSKDHYWVTHWEDQKALSDARVNKVMDEIVRFLKTKGARSGIRLSRPEQGVSPESVTLFGDVPKERICIEECGKYWIQFQGVRHPGLFLDHLPLRQWLQTHCQGRKVLNTFSYTGSLSVAAGLGGARSVTTLDLSKPVVQWAKENWMLNNLPEDSGRFISGDVFEWLPRLKRQKEEFDCVILDPPSFSHGKGSRFSTAKDLAKLQGLAMDLIPVGGLLVTSINSANISWEKYTAEVLAASQARKMKFSLIKQIDLPETFVTSFGERTQRYLKGWVLRRSE